MKRLAIIALLLFQTSCISAMFELKKLNKSNSWPFNVDILTKMALSSVIFSGMYALVDISSGNCSKASLLQAIKDGFVTGATLGCSMAICNDLPMNVLGAIWVATIGIAPAVLVINNFLLKRAIGLSAS
jgi:hypothetical protein